MAGLAGVGQRCAPVGAQFFRPRIGAIKIVVADDEMRREWQPRRWHGFEPAVAVVWRPALAAGVGPKVRVIDIGRRHEERANHASALEFLARKHDSRNTQLVRHNDDRLRRAAGELGDAVAPDFHVRIVPIVLDDAPRCFEATLPAALPVVGAAVLPARHNQDINVRGFHGAG